MALHTALPQPQVWRCWFWESPRALGVHHTHTHSKHEPEQHAEHILTDTETSPIVWPVRLRWFSKPPTSSLFHYELHITHTPDAQRVSNALCFVISRAWMPLVGLVNFTFLPSDLESWLIGLQGVWTIKCWYSEMDSLQLREADSWFLTWTRLKKTHTHIWFFFYIFQNIFMILSIIKDKSDDNPLTSIQTNFYLPFCFSFSRLCDK